MVRKHVDATVGILFFHKIAVCIVVITDHVRTAVRASADSADGGDFLSSGKGVDAVDPGHPVTVGHSHIFGVRVIDGDIFTLPVRRRHGPVRGVKSPLGQGIALIVLKAVLSGNACQVIPPLGQDMALAVRFPGQIMHVIGIVIAVGESAAIGVGYGGQVIVVIVTEICPDAIADCGCDRACDGVDP